MCRDTAVLRIESFRMRGTNAQSSRSRTGIKDILFTNQIMIKHRMLGYGMVMGTLVTSLHVTSQIRAQIGSQMDWKPWNVVMESNAFFVITNLIITPDQKQDVCPESDGINGVICRNDSDCTPNEPTLYGHGK
ncbi:hypothetical protein QZH41_014011 [Actinostola sp. cb2023]|nr:hypothetical protein QZH41_014011 [Actinostola sp. cb2023]